MSVAGAIVGGIVDSGGVVDGGTAGRDEGSYTPTERITNGAFADGSSWTLVSSAWVIAAGVATRSGGIGALRQSIALTNSGRSVAVSVDVTNAVGATLTIAFQMDGTTVQTPYALTPSTGTITFSVSADAEFNGIQFASTGAAGLIIDNVSLIA